MAENSKETIRGLVRQYASQFGVPYELSLSVLERESSYDPRAVSPKGAQGLMQLMPALQASYNVTDPFDPAQNIRGGIEHLSVLLKLYKNNTSFALAAYNAGEPAVTRAGGVPNFPETQQYVEAVQARAAQLQDTPVTSREVAGPGRGWIYPTEELQSPTYAGKDFLGNVREEPLPPDDPKRQGIMVSFTGGEPTKEEIDYIYSQVDPRAFITREDITGLAAGGATTAADLARLTERGRHVFGAARKATRGALSFAGKFGGPVGWVGMPLLAAGAGVGAEFYRQGLVPDTVTVPGGRTFGIDSWPRENAAGIEYEGAPDTAAEKIWAATVAGIGEGALEFGAGLLAKGAQRAGQWYKGTGFHRDTKVMQEGLGVRDPKTGMWHAGTSAAEAPAEFGISPAASGARSAANLGTTADNLTKALVNQADESLNNPAIDRSKLLENFNEFVRAGTSPSRTSLYGDTGWRGLDQPQQQAARAFRPADFSAEDYGIPRLFSDLGSPQLEAEAMRIASNLAMLGGDGPLSLPVANMYRTAQNRLAAAAFKGPSTGSVTDAQQVAKAAAQALRRTIIDTMKEAEQTVTSRGLRGFFGRLPRPAERFEKFLDRSHNLINASELAFRSAREGAPGVFQAGLGFGLAPAAIGAGALATAAGVPAATAALGTGLGALGVSQLLPRARALTGGAVFRAGAQAPSVSANIFRAIQGARTTGTEVPGSRSPRPPAIDLSSFFAAGPPPASPQMLQPPLEGQGPPIRPEPFEMLGLRRQRRDRRAP